MYHTTTNVWDSKTNDDHGLSNKCEMLERSKEFNEESSCKTSFPVHLLIPTKFINDIGITSDGDEGYSRKNAKMDVATSADASFSSNVGPMALTSNFNGPTIGQATVVPCGKKVGDKKGAVTKYITSVTPVTSSTTTCPENLHSSHNSHLNNCDMADGRTVGMDASTETENPLIGGDLLNLECPLSVDHENVDTEAVPLSSSASLHLNERKLVCIRIQASDQIETLGKDRVLRDNNKQYAKTGIPLKLHEMDTSLGVQKASKSMLESEKLADSREKPRLHVAGLANLNNLVSLRVPSSSDSSDPCSPKPALSTPSTSDLRSGLTEKTNNDPNLKDFVISAKSTTSTGSNIHASSALVSTQARLNTIGSLESSPAQSVTTRDHRKRDRRERRRDRSQSIPLNPCNHDALEEDLTPNRCAINSVNVQNRELALHMNDIRDPTRPGIDVTLGCQSRSVELVNAFNPQLSDGNRTESNYVQSHFTDLLSAHFPPPYSTLPAGASAASRLGIAGVAEGAVPLPAVSVPVLTAVPTPHSAQVQIPLPLSLTHPQMVVPTPPNCLLPAGQPAVRYHFSPPVTTSRRSYGISRGVSRVLEEEPKSCCGMSSSQTVSIRWFVLIIAIIGISCTIAGTTLGATYSTGKEHLTLSLVMIGVGVVLLTVSAVAWRLTANDSGASCRVMLGFSRRTTPRGDGGAEPNRRFAPRLPPTYGRPHHPYAAMMYPDFQCRPPPPSYQASMQEYRLRLLLLERSDPMIAAAAALSAPSALTVIPPPPAYRPYNGIARLNGAQNVPSYSRPPSYRSRSSGNHVFRDNATRLSLDPAAGHHHMHHVVLDPPIHSRDPSLLSYLSQQSMADNVSIVSGHVLNGNSSGNTAVVTVMQAVSVGMDLTLDMFPNSHSNNNNKELSDRQSAKDVREKAKNPPNSDKSLKMCDSLDGNLVRIVQTTDSSQVIRRDSVIVTVSGSDHSLWNQHLHHRTNSQPLLNHFSHSPSHNVLGICTGASTGVLLNENQVQQGSEVQILAHL